MQGAARATLAAPPDVSAALAAREAELVTLAREREMARATIASLRAELARAGERAAGERAELALYRRIGSDAQPDGLAIDTLARRRGEPPTLLVTLLQARGRDRIGGRVEITALAAAVAEPEAVAIAGAGETPSDAAGSDDAGVASVPAESDGAVVRWSATFDFRFFETLEIPLDGTVDGFPPTIDVRVVPDAKSPAPFVRRFRREDVVIVD